MGPTCPSAPLQFNIHETIDTGQLRDETPIQIKEFLFALLERC